jgi:hypothetical protein
MEEPEGTRPEQEEEDVEAHRRKTAQASEGAPSAEGEEEDDVELHKRPSAL